MPAVTHGLRIVASDSNKLGDTLTLLTRDLFHTLGYEDCRFNVHKPGRELDVEARHCYENRRMFAECKATSEPIGGSDINKFVGALDVERRRHAPTPLHGYFVSLSGFRESAVEQEKDAGGDRVTLITGHDIVRRLTDGNVVVRPEVAIENATRCAATVSADLRVMDVELLGHADGWAWSVRFGVEDEPTHVCLVHADGRVLSEAAAAALLGSLPGLRVLHGKPRIGPSDPEPDLDYYKDYLLNEYGAITLEGMPADHEVGSRSFRLESLYVPLLLQPDDVHVGTLLHDQSRIAVLGPPGAGKTTILKRLAIAYADPARKPDLDDALPDDDWLPVFIRCRHVAGGSGHNPITEIIGDLMVRAERPEKRQEFVEAVSRKLRDGQVLLLVDGLDEISDTSERVAFVSQLRTFLARYPSIKVVVTSREVGFRAVAGAVAAICDPHRVAELSGEGVRQLVQAWHREVLGERADVERDAAELADSILMSDRVMRLAVNPLLLTTLLLVKRWVGQLPRKRTVLYQKAVEVLLMTWNVEGHQPIDQDEALPQLAYAAFCMMEARRTQVSANELTLLFREARAAMQEIFAYTRTSVSDFIQRVEERSSLLVLSGHEVIDGSLQPLYEFKHLTFQEYLTALAITQGWVPEDRRDDSPAAMLHAHLGNESWREVVSLTGVMSGRRAAGLIELLTKRLRDPKWKNMAGLLEENLVDCLHDEVAIPPELARTALETIIERRAEPSAAISPLRRLLNTRFADLVHETLSDAILNNKKPLGNYCLAFSDVVTAGLPTKAASAEEVSDQVLASIESGGLLEQCSGAGRLVNAAYVVDARENTHEFTGMEGLGLTWSHLASPAQAAAERFVAGLPEAASLIFAWALVWCTEILQLDDELSAEVQNRALTTWLATDDPDLAYFSSWLAGNLAHTPLWHEHVDREQILPKMEARWHEIWRSHLPPRETEMQRFALIMVAVRLGGPWSNPSMIDMVRTTARKNGLSDRTGALLDVLGAGPPKEPQGW